MCCLQFICISPPTDAYPIKSEFRHLDNTRVVERIIGIGGSGIIIQQGQYALKIPRISRVIERYGVPVSKGRLTPEEGNYDERPPLIQEIEDEKAIYRRLGDHSGILSCYNLSSSHPSIEMALMKNGDLRHYLDQTRPERSQQLTWLTQMAHTLAYIHHQRVVIADIRSDNLLLDDDFDLKFADFGNSTLMPVDWYLCGEDDLGYSILSDIGQFGALMFEIVAGHKCQFDIFHDWKEPADPTSWPPRVSLPSTTGMWLGHIVEKCWTKGYKTANDLAAELDKEIASKPQERRARNCEPCSHLSLNFMDPRSQKTLARDSHSIFEGNFRKSWSYCQSARSTEAGNRIYHGMPCTKRSDDEVITIQLGRHRRDLKIGENYTQNQVSYMQPCAGKSTGGPKSIWRDTYRRGLDEPSSKSTLTWRGGRVSPAVTIMAESESPLSSPPSTDDEMAIQIAKPAPKGLDRYFKPSTKKESSPETPKRAPSPPHEYTLADNDSIAVLVMFRSRFSDAFPKSLPHYGPQDIESGVSSPLPDENVERYLCALLGLVLNRKKDVEKGHYGRALEDAISTHQNQWPTAWKGTNPLHGGHNFNNMTSEQRLTLLKSLVLWSLNSSEAIQALLKESYKQTRRDDDKNQPRSVQPWFSDSYRRRYWLVEGQEDSFFRVYRENDGKTAKSNAWFSVAGTIDEVNALADKLTEEGSSNARLNAEKLRSAIPRFEQGEEKRRRREYRIARKAAFARPEPGFSMYEGRTRGKRMKYTYSDGEEESDSLSHRSTRNATPADLPTVTASGRQVKPRMVGAYGESMLLDQRRELEASLGESGIEDSEDMPTTAPSGRPMRVAARPTKLSARSREVYQGDDEDAESDSDAQSSGKEWSGDENEPDVDEEEESEGDFDEDDDVDAVDEGGDNTVESLVVKLSYRKKPPGLGVASQEQDVGYGKANGLPLLAPRPVWPPVVAVAPTSEPVNGEHVNGIKGEEEEDEIEDTVVLPPMRPDSFSGKVNGNVDHTGALTHSPRLEQQPEPQPQPQPQAQAMDVT